MSALNEAAGHSRHESPPSGVQKPAAHSPQVACVASRRTKGSDTKRGAGSCMDRSTAPMLLLLNVLQDSAMDLGFRV
jgi:hypothetical protein